MAGVLKIDGAGQFDAQSSKTGLLGCTTTLLLHCTMYIIMSCAYVWFNLTLFEKPSQWEVLTIQMNRPTCLFASTESSTMFDKKNIAFSTNTHFFFALSGRRKHHPLVMNLWWTQGTVLIWWNFRVKLDERVTRISSKTRQWPVWRFKFQQNRSNIQLNFKSEKTLTNRWFMKAKCFSTSRLILNSLEFKLRIQASKPLIAHLEQSVSIVWLFGKDFKIKHPL